MKQRFLFSITIFLTSFLLFLIQPMIAKMILPMLGGTQNVWNVCLVFYQVTLLFGYYYAHKLRSNFSLKKQRWIHLGLLFSAIVFFMPLNLRTYLGLVNYPVLFVLSSLAMSIFIPFFVLSSCSPLLQSFFATSSNYKRDNPYFLYRASNLGSFLALFLYPIYIETNLAVSSQRYLWSVFFVVALFLVFLRQREADKHELKEIKQESKEQITTKDRLKWIFISFVPSSLMIGVTNKLTIDINPMPLLWVIPLGLYLLSFIFGFSDFLLKNKKKIFDFHLAFLSILFMFIITGTSNVFAVISIHLLVFFIIAITAHLRLYELRPSSGNLTEFYLYLSIGGALGGFFNAIIAPYVFNSLIEYNLVLLLSVFIRSFDGFKKENLSKIFMLIYIITVCMVSIRFVSKESQLDAYFFIFWLIFGYAFVFFKKNIPLLFILFSGCLISANLFIKKSKYELELKGRNFYGTYQVLLEKNDNSYFKMLRHGNIFHGFMDMNSPLSKIGYYSEESPLGSFFKETEVNNKNWDFALIGLGAGASLCYFKDTQSLDIYEIDEEIVKLSTEKNVFPFMRDCKKDAKIIIGDGRVMLANQDKKYDAIIIDAFSSDAIPSHLLTREAFLVYLSKLKEDGLMLFHISNLYIDLEGVIDKAIKGTGIKALVAEGGENESLQKTFSSKWVVLSKADLTNFKEKYGFKELKQNDEIKYFTDDYSSIYKAIKLRFRLKQG